MKKPVYRCNRMFCHVCLKTCYDEDFMVAKNSRNWICQFCLGLCFCTRCLRQDVITQLKAFYFAQGGYFKSLVKERSLVSEIDRVIFKNLKTHLLLTLLCNVELCQKYPTFMQIASQSQSNS